jgi:hypothetical protein
LNLGEHLRALELELLESTTRKNAERVSDLLSDSFQEFGSSGRIYSKRDIILALQEETPISISLSDFEMKLLSDQVALVTYKSVKARQNALPSTALRSSIWLQDGDRWRMIFHQGTKLPPPDPVIGY